ncbi:collagen alpha-1(XXVIII) chain-like [Arapaima gigas]
MIRPALERTLLNHICESGDASRVPATLPEGLLPPLTATDLLVDVPEKTPMPELDRDLERTFPEAERPTEPLETPLEENHDLGNNNNKYHDNNHYDNNNHYENNNNYENNNHYENNNQNHDNNNHYKNNNHLNNRRDNNNNNNNNNNNKHYKSNNQNRKNNNHRSRSKSTRTAVSSHTDGLSRSSNGMKKENGTRPQQLPKRLSSEIRSPGSQPVDLLVQDVVVPGNLN